MRRFQIYQKKTFLHFRIFISNGKSIEAEIIKMVENECYHQKERLKISGNSSINIHLSSTTFYDLLHSTKKIMSSPFISIQGKNLKYREKFQLILKRNFVFQIFMIINFTALTTMSNVYFRFILKAFEKKFFWIRFLNNSHFLVFEIVYLNEPVAGYRQLGSQLVFFCKQPSLVTAIKQ